MNTHYSDVEFSCLANSDIKNAIYPLFFYKKGMFAVKERKCMILEGCYYIQQHFSK